MAERFKNIKWDIRKGNAGYRSVSTPILAKWIKEGKIRRGEVEVWRSGLSGFRRPEDLDELKPYFRIWDREQVPRRPKEKIYHRERIESVLIIDDEKDLCSLIAEILSEKGYRVITANTGRQGTSKLRKNRPDLILLDLKLPDVEGTKLLSRIRKNYPQIPLLMISAYGNEEVKKKAKSLGAEQFIDKPFTPEGLLKEIKKISKR